MTALQGRSEQKDQVAILNSLPLLQAKEVLVGAMATQLMASDQLGL
jgi:hypothetical protein